MIHWLEPEMVTAWIAAMLRCFGFFTSAPVLARQIPTRIRLALCSVLAFVVTPAAAATADVPPTWLGLAGLGAGEFMLGVAMGWMALLMFSAVHIAGTVMGFQIGTGVSQLFDPQLGEQSSELGRLMTSLIGLGVVVAGGHHIFVRGLFDSFAHIPAGGHWFDPDLSLTAARLMGGVLLAGCEMALPVVAVTMLNTLAIALSVRATPQLNIYFAFGILLNLLLGLLVTAYVLKAPMGGIPEVLSNMVRASQLPWR